jgi:hypothetical protein
MGGGGVGRVKGEILYIGLGFFKNRRLLFGVILNELNRKNMLKR